MEKAMNQDKLREALEKIATEGGPDFDADDMAACAQAALTAPAPVEGLELSEEIKEALFLMPSMGEWWHDRAMDFRRLLARQPEAGAKSNDDPRESCGRCLDSAHCSRHPEAVKQECEPNDCACQPPCFSKPEAVEKDDGMIRFLVSRPRGEMGFWDADGDWRPKGPEAEATATANEALVMWKEKYPDAPEATK